MMSSAAVRRGRGKQLGRSLEGRSSFLKKKQTRIRKEGFEEREALLWALCAVLKKKKNTP